MNMHIELVQLKTNKDLMKSGDLMVELTGAHVHQSASTNHTVPQSAIKKE